MESAGSLLKQERERQKKDLRDIADATKISITALQAIEGTRLEFLPPPSYTRGFIKIYARELGLDPGEVLRLYEQDMLHCRRWGAQQELICRKPKRRARLFVACALVACGAAALVWFMSLDRTRRGAVTGLQEQTPVTTPAAIQSAVVAESSATTTVNLLPEQQPQPSAPVAERPAEEPVFSVRFAAHERTWMRFHADNQSAVDVMLRPGEDHTQTARKRLRVRIGNPGGVSVFFNNQPVTMPDDRSKPLDMQFPQ